MAAEKVNGKDLATGGPAMNKLFEMLKQYWGRLHEIPLSEVKEILEATQAEMPPCVPNTEGFAMCLRPGVAVCKPEQFYLSWHQQSDRLIFLKHFLTALKDHGELRQIQRPDSYRRLLNKAVAVHIGDNYYVRGFICDTERRTVNIFLYDYGDVVSDSIDRLFELPEELCNIPPMCFRATLVPRRPEFKFHPLVDALFTDIMKAEYEDVSNEISEGMDCRIIGIHQNERTKAVEAYQVEITMQLGPEQMQESLYKYLCDVHGEMADDSDDSYSKPWKFQNQRIKLLRSGAYCDSEIDVKEYSDRNIDSLKKVRVIHIVSPSEFYLQNVSNVLNPPWNLAMQSFYSNKEKSQNSRIITSCVFPNRCYVWQDEDTKLWERVRVIQYPVPGRSLKTARLWLLDKGRAVLGDMADMMELHREFALPALAFQAELVHVKPVDKEDGCWSEDATAFFHIICRKDKIFDAAVVKVKKTVRAETAPFSPPISSSYEVILAEENSAKCHRQETVQAVMVQTKLAYADGPSCGHPGLAHLSGAGSSYSRKELKCELNCIVGGTHGNKDELLNNLHEHRILPLGGHLERQEDDCDPEYLPPAIAFRMGAVTISCVRSPGIFYVQMKKNEEALAGMMNDIAEIVEKLSPYESQLVPGEVVLARVTPSLGKPFYAWEWARVVVTSVNNDESAQVKGIAIDFGSEHRIEGGSVRKLPKALEAVPQFCQRCHLDFMSENLKMTTPTWTNNTQIFWRRYIMAWQFSKPQYYASQNVIRKQPDELHGERGDRNKVKLEEFNQELVFDGEKNDWVATRPKKLPQYSAVNRNRHRMLLRQFYESVGVNLTYCDRPNATDGVVFCPAWDVLRTDDGRIYC